MMDIHFVIDGQPVAQGRPKFFRRAGFVGVYDPKKSRNWKKEVADQALRQLGDDAQLEGALRMTLIFRMQRPKYLPKRVVYHTKTPDVDNLVKGVKDALQGICYKGDQQIVHLNARKEYAEKDCVPCVLVTINKLKEEAELEIDKTKITKKQKKVL